MLGRREAGRKEVEEEEVQEQRLETQCPGTETETEIGSSPPGWGSCGGWVCACGGMRGRMESGLLWTRSCGELGSRPGRFRQLTEEMLLPETHSSL